MLDNIKIKNKMSKRVIVRLHEVADKNCKNKEDLEFFFINDTKNLPSWIKDNVVRKLEEFYDVQKIKEETNIDLNEYQIYNTYNEGDRVFLLLVNKNDSTDILNIDKQKIPITKHFLKRIYTIQKDIQEIQANDNVVESTQNTEISFFIWNYKEFSDFVKKYVDESKNKELDRLINNYNDKCFFEVEIL